MISEGLIGLGVDALEGRDRLLLAQVSDVVEDRGGVLVSGPQAIQVEHADAARRPKAIAVSGLITESIGAAIRGISTW